ncbi:hypothetical protein Btru_006990 [Bulinus truncatus]|nr:hypothetical protein Btru_006990 [Bulinus truncatus]
MADLDENATDGTTVKQTSSSSFRAPFFSEFISMYLRLDRMICFLMQLNINELYKSQHANDCWFPEPNQDVISKKQSKDYDIIVIESVKEPRFETEIIGSILSRMESELEKKQKCSNQIDELLSKEEFLHYKDVIEQLEADIRSKEMCSLISDEEILAQVDSSRIDWMKISKMNFSDNTTWVDCQKAWENQVCPKLNTALWSIEESKKLKQIVAKSETKEWEKIAAEMGVRRGKADKVAQIIKDGLGHYRWTQVASLMDSRSPHECMSRFAKINPRQNVGKWSETEDKKNASALTCCSENSPMKFAQTVVHKPLGQMRTYYLPIRCLDLHGLRIAKFVGTRNSLQCRDRYCNCLAPSLNFERFMASDVKLLKLHKKMGPLWAKMVPHFKGRTDHMLLSRYNPIKKWKERRQNGSINCLSRFDSFRPPLHFKYIKVQVWKITPLSQKERWHQKFAKYFPKSFQINDSATTNGESPAMLEESEDKETIQSSSRSLFILLEQQKEKNNNAVDEELKNLLCTKIRRRTTKQGRARRYFDKDSRPESKVEAELVEIKHTVPSILMKSLGTNASRLCTLRQVQETRVL